MGASVDEFPEPRKATDERTGEPGAYAAADERKNPAGGLDLTVYSGHYLYTTSRFQDVKYGLSTSPNLMVTCPAVGFHAFISKFDFLILNNNLLMFVWSRLDKNRIRIWVVSRFRNRI